MSEVPYNYAFFVEPVENNVYLLAPLSLFCGLSWAATIYANDSFETYATW